MPAPDLFAAPDITAWQNRLNHSADFAAAAADWVGRLLLIEDDVTKTPLRYAWLVVDQGRCTEARVGRADDEAAADYVLAATATTWSDLIASRTTPTMAALGGRLSLHKGDVMKLIPHAKAAAALLAEFAAD